MPETLTPRQAAVLLHVTSSTVRRWIQEGRLPSYRTLGGQYRLRHSDVNEMLRRSALNQEAMTA